MKKFVRAVGRFLLLLVLLACGAVVLFHALRWRGYILLPQEADPRQWEVFGVDVSVYQGDVDWTALRDQGVDFAFIKATEGSSLQDRKFADNWRNAQSAGVRVGAYHFFSYDSPGETQADNFIDQVPVTAGALPPVVDVEFYGDKLQNLPDKAHVKSVLDPLLSRLEEHYGVRPILYATYRSYDLYLREGYGEYPLWLSSPMLAPLGKDWTFWQYSHSAELEGYYGTERRIDLNVFRGSMEAFRAFGQAD